MDIEHLGEKTVAALIEAGKLHDAADIYRITADDLTALGGFKDRSVANLLGAIEASKQRPLDRLLVGLSIRHVGGTVATLLANRLKSLEAIAAASEEELADVGGVGPTIAASVAAWFADDGNQDLVRRLVEAGVNTKADGGTGPDLPQTLAGMSFVLTGGLDGFTRTRPPGRSRTAAAGSPPASPRRPPTSSSAPTPAPRPPAPPSSASPPSTRPPSPPSSPRRRWPMSDVWHPLDPEGSRPQEPSGGTRGPTRSRSCGRCGSRSCSPGWWWR